MIYWKIIIITPLSRAHMSAEKCKRIVSHELFTKIKPLVGTYIYIYRSVQSINFVYYTMYTNILYYARTFDEGNASYLGICFREFLSKSHCGVKYARNFESLLSVRSSSSFAVVVGARLTLLTRSQLNR